MKLLTVLFITILFVSSCDDVRNSGAREFSTSGIYAAPKSTLQIEIHSKGKIKSGDDLASSAETNFNISSIKSDKTSISGSIKLLENKEVIVIDNKEYQDANLKKVFLEKLTNENLSFDTNEFDEIIRAIQGCSAGPKGMVLAGQAKYLKVIDTKYDYK